MNPQHVVLVIGGAVAGSEAAYQFAQRGIRLRRDRPERATLWQDRGRAAALARQPATPADAEDRREAGPPRGPLRSPDEAGPGHQPAGAPDVGTERRGLGRRGLARPALVASGSRPVYRAGACIIRIRFIYWFNHYPEPGYRGPRVESGGRSPRHRGRTRLVGRRQDPHAGDRRPGPGQPWGRGGPLRPGAPGHRRGPRGAPPDSRRPGAPRVHADLSPRGRGHARRQSPGGRHPGADRADPGHAPEVVA